MEFTAAETEAFTRLTGWALEEDLAPTGVDLTSDAVIPADAIGTAILIARVSGILAGMPAAEGTFSMVDPRLSFQQVAADGQRVEPGARLAVVTGRMRSILTGERTALNFLQRLSGVATLTRRYADLIVDLPCRLLDTRKTTPGWRTLEKYAVRCGGGFNHRMGLGDGILIKDNHLATISTDLSAVAEAVKRARLKYGSRFPIEVEVDNLEQLERALSVEPDVILLDNMTPAQLSQAVRRRNETAAHVLLEASGGVNLETLRAIAETGVDRVSVGALTHSAVALDIALDYVTA
jgi:nicotinate-nucleotide pyrophosphorylase (carboxylating)